ncbi:hypothetical protein F4677DRAFT_148903 [Hypoxylon crocopeplum]|nr:hypothetical protein F4677DRAFT_148903 [Hypoxylon crocopeplum]
MSLDVQDISGDHVERLTKLLSRRPEYGIAIPSRRWLDRQGQKMKSLPSEILRTSNLLKRLVIKIADSIDPNVIDPRAVLCGTHAALNPWLIRRLFLAIAYEVTVHTDLLRSWKGKRDIPMLSAFIGRVDAIAALWTEPELYHKCYGTPPFENHMVFVRSGCEACILSAIGANACVLADLRSILVDRIERRPSRSDKRPAKDPRLSRFVESWINHLKDERAAKCRSMSDNVLAELRASRPQLMQWRNRRRKEHKNARVARQPIYTELRSSGSGHQLSSVPVDSRRRRRTRHGIPVAMADPEGAEEQRRVAMFSMTDGAPSIFRPDNMCDYSQVGVKQTLAYDLKNERDSVDDGLDPYDDYEEVEGQEDLERDLEDEERGRSKVTDWYTSRLTESCSGLTTDDAKSVMSMIHPAFQRSDAFSQLSAVPLPLSMKKDHQSTVKVKATTNGSVWTDATVYSADGHIVKRGATDVPPVPRIPSQYKHNSRLDDGESTSASRPSRAARSLSRASGRKPGQSIVASSVYSDQSMPMAGATVAGTRPLKGSEASSYISTHQKQDLGNHQRIRDYSRMENPFTNESSQRAASNRRQEFENTNRVPERHSFPSGRRTNTGGTTPMTPDEEAWRESWGIRSDDDEYDDPVRPEDSLTTVMWQQVEESLENITPWGNFARKSQK